MPNKEGKWIENDATIHLEKMFCGYGIFKQETPYYEKMPSWHQNVSSLLIYFLFE